MISNTGNLWFTSSWPQHWGNTLFIDSKWSVHAERSLLCNRLGSLQTEGNQATLHSGKFVKRITRRKQLSSSILRRVMLNIFSLYWLDGPCRTQDEFPGVSILSYFPRVSNTHLLQIIFSAVSLSLTFFFPPQQTFFLSGVFLATSSKFFLLVFFPHVLTMISGLRRGVNEIFAILVNW